jgi:hypothetical protein
MSPAARKNSLLVIFFILSLSSPLLAAEVTPVSYNVKAAVEPDRGTIAVQAKLNIPIKPQSKNFQFQLHETFDIKRLLLDGKRATFSEHAVEPSFMAPAVKTVTVSLPPGLSHDKVQMDIAYEGRLKNIPEFGTYPDQKIALDDQINSHLVELAGYSSWHPIFKWGEPIHLEQLEVSLPKGWTSVCSGQKLGEQVKGSRVITRWSSPKDLDIVIVASPNFKEKAIHQFAVDIQIYYTRMPEQFIAQEGRQISDVIQLYTDYLGTTGIPGGTVRHVYSPKRKGQGKAGFARSGLIVTSEGRTLDALAQNPKFSLFQGIAHEIAHFWWNFGVGQGDWINEAFAEYFSAVAVQKISSQQEFESVLADYRKQVSQLPASAPSLSEVPFASSQVVFVVRYYKGSLMLDSLRRTLGDERFFPACREFFQTYEGKPTETKDFRAFWEKKLADRKDWLDAWLNSKGGLPGSTQNQGGSY